MKESNRVKVSGWIEHCTCPGSFLADHEVLVRAVVVVEHEDCLSQIMGQIVGHKATLPLAYEGVWALCLRPALENLEKLKNRDAAFKAKEVE